ncbi:fam-a protein, fragment [Plasmodium vinckei lentum]|uniref:Fam-a protein n=1 Tax=Plasmodium vinckei lentum TaxID=138297 RepID=A0A6V7S378_PLAVN|nr:fam-a protein, fragment [Plasmodium vinckei lentum]
MNEAVKRLEHYAISKDGYILLGKRSSNIFLYKKKHEGHTNIERIIYSVDDPNKYNKIINEIWDSNHANSFNTDFVKNTTIIVMASADINDHNPSSKEFKNPIIENVNLFKADINSEEGTRNGKLKKAFVNIDGYLIKKNTAINGHDCI